MPPQLSNQPQSKWVTIAFAGIGFNASDDAQHQIRNGQEPYQEDADQHQYQKVCDGKRDQHRDLEVERFLRMRRDKRVIVFLDQPNDERGNEAEKNATQMGEQGDDSVFLGRGMSIHHYVSFHGATESAAA